MKRFLRFTVPLCLFLSFCPSLFAQFIGFTGRNGFGNPRHEQAFSVHFDHLVSSNQMVLAGNADDVNVELSTKDAMVTILDECFEPDRTVFYGLPNDNERFTSIRPYANLSLGNGYLAVGTSESIFGVKSGIIFLLRADLGVSQAKRVAGLQDITLASAEVTSDGGFVVAGTRVNNLGNEEALVMKYNVGFTLDWSVLIGRQDDDDRANSVIQAEDGSIWVCGKTESFSVGGGSDAMIANLELTTGALTTTAGTPNLYAIGIENDEVAFDLCENPDNGTIGLTGSFDNGIDRDILYINFTPASAALPASATMSTYGDQGLDFGRSLSFVAGTAASPSGYMIVGQQNSAGAAGIDGFVLRISNSGLPLLGEHYGGSNIDFFMEIDKNRFTNSYVIGGSSRSTTGVMAPDHVFWMDTDATLSLDCPFGPAYSPTRTIHNPNVGEANPIRTGPNSVNWMPNNIDVNFITEFPFACGMACKKGGSSTPERLASEASQLQVYPNPGKDQIQLSSDKEITRIEIIDVHGKSCLQHSGESKNLSIDVSSLSTGLYFIRSTTADGETKHLKWIKK